MFYYQGMSDMFFEISITVIDEVGGFKLERFMYFLSYNLKVNKFPLQVTTIIYEEIR